MPSRPLDTRMTSEPESLTSSAPELTALLSTQGEPEYEAVLTRSYPDSVRERALAGQLPSLDPSFRLVLPVDWCADPIHDRSWRYRLHTLQFLDVLCQIYRDERDLHPLRTACAVALDWVRNNSRDGPEVSEFAWYDMAVGIRVAYLAYLLRAGSPAGALSEEDTGELFQSVLEHADFLLADENYADRHNHGLFQDEGLLVAADYLDFLPEADAWRTKARARVVDTFTNTIRVEEGIHLEHSPAYQCAIVNMLRRLTRRDELLREELLELKQRMELSTGWFVTPREQFPPVGDSPVQRAPHWARRAARRAAEDATGLRGFPRSGYGMVRAKNSYLLLTAAHHSSAHKHEDELSFVLEENGVSVVTDTGYFGYHEKDPRRQYDRSALAHNGLVVDGQSSLWRRAPAYGSGLEAFGAGSDWYALQGRNPHLAASGVEHRRLLVYRPARALIIVDELSADEEHSYTRLFHFGPELSCTPMDAGTSFEGPDASGRVRDWGDGPAQMRLVKGQLEPNVQGWFFPRPREEVEVFTLELETIAASARLISILSIGSPELRLDRFDEDADERVLGLIAGGDRSSLAVRREGTDLHIASLEGSAGSD